MAKISSSKLFVLTFAVVLCFTGISQAQHTVPKITTVERLNSSTFELNLDNDRHILVDFYGDNIFRLFADDSSQVMRPPHADPEAQILVNNPRRAVGAIKYHETNDQVVITSTAVELTFNKENTLFKVKNTQTGELVVKEKSPIKIGTAQTTLTLEEASSEYFYGGGVQNGRFSHKGKIVDIANENSWNDGGVASPNPFYWSTQGYALMWFTFEKGKYDFGAKQKGVVDLYHEMDHLDVFFMIDNGAVNLLNDYYQLTGHPVLLPKFAFYEGHLNAYNRDFWKEDSTGILFEDGKRYKESQKDNGGIKESLNGEKDNYQFSARAVIDRYADHDMPLGWILPNDGYGAGYGQTSTLDSNITNLKKFGDYARSKGVELGLWTQSSLHPQPDVKALLQRDIIKEVKDAGVRALKTDVAWVGPGYSFGLNGIADVANTTIQYGDNARPFIISLDGWAGTQRYAAVWSGDQTGGYWEYIRFHIPTYIGAGLSGEPNITSDMDGIFGGEHPEVNIRDFQWKTFTPMELNMDGWGSNPKYPQALGEPATSINRNYLKLKSELLPYTYSIAHQAVDGLPMIRAMFLNQANPFTLGTETKYQFMFGPYFLVAPIYQDTQADEQGNDIRNNIYLPEGTWIDYFTGKQYRGNQIVNYFDAPLWKLPIFVKPGAIIPLNAPNNNVNQVDKDLRIYELYPAEHSRFTEYDDDGNTEAYKNGAFVSTEINTELTSKNVAQLSIDKTKGSFKGFEKNKKTILRFNVSEKPRNVRVKINGERVRLKKVKSKKDFAHKTNVYHYEPEPDFNKFPTPDSAFAEKEIIRNPQFWVKIAATDVTQNAIEVEVKGYKFDIANDFGKTEGELTQVQDAEIVDSNRKSFSLSPSWTAVKNADYYDIQFNDMRYTHIKDTTFVFDELQPDSTYSFKIRAVNKSEYSEWVNLKSKTADDPLRYAIPHIAAYSTTASQAGFEIGNFFDGDDNSLWHTKYQKKAPPFDIVMDLKSVNQLDKVQYLPRKNGVNGAITKAELYYSKDKKNWKKAGDIEWEANSDEKEYKLSDQPTARYLKLTVKEGKGDYGSGREFYVFKVPGSSSFIPGDINSDGVIDRNDLISYTNYTGLRKGDSDFEGYISKGDINNNDLIDAFDISNVTTQLEGGVKLDSVVELKGELSISTDKKHFERGDTITITVHGKHMQAVNGVSFALPYDTKEYEFIGVEDTHVKQMEDLSKDRLHSNGDKALYPTFINLGNKEPLKGDGDLFILKFKAKQDLTFNLKPIDGIFVSKSLEEIHF